MHLIGVENAVPGVPRSQLFKIFVIMRMVAIMLLIGSLQVSAKSFSQLITVSVEKASLEEVFRAIKKQTSYTFWYENKLIKDSKKIDLDVKNLPLMQVLDRCLENQPLHYKIVGNTIVIMRKVETENISVLDLPVLADLTGTVVDADGKPISGVSVVIKGKTSGVQTNADGGFNVTAVQPTDILVFSAVGYESKEIKVGNRTQINVELNIHVRGMDETVVVAYGTSKVKDITGSVVSIGAKDIRNAPMTSSLQSLLQGKVAGVNVALQSASPTGSVSVIIRGMSSISGNNQPLWVIDGIPDYSSSTAGTIANALLNLNVDDISSIEILKDASATALYGSRAANGVVIVTSKKGSKNQKPTIELNSRWGVTAPRFNKYDMMDSPDFIHFMREAAIESVINNGTLNTDAALLIDANAFNNLNSREFDRNSLVFLDDAFRKGNTNWLKTMTQNALNVQNSISLRGGNEDLIYYASVNHRLNKGIVANGFEKQFGGILNLEAKIGKRVKMGINLNGSTRNTDNKDAMMTVLRQMRPDYPAFNEDGTLFTLPGMFENPYTTLQNSILGSAQNFRGTLMFDVPIIKSLFFRTSYNIAFSKTESLSYYGRGSIYYDNSTGNRTRSDAKNETNVWENTINFKEVIGKHDITLLGGLSTESYAASTYGMAATNFPDDEVLNGFSSGATRGALTETNNENSLVSQFARAHYKFNDKYIISGTIRRDGSSKFGPGKKWGIFPSGAAAWVLSEENFIKNRAIGKYVSYLKLRVSHGLAGSQNLGNYAWMTNVSGTRYNEQPAIAPSSIGNSELRWEKATMTDIALEYALWNDRIRGTLGIYEKTTNDLIYTIPLPLSSSFSTITSNIGAMENKGIEFDIRADVYKTNDLTLNLDFNIASNVTKMLKINGVVKELLFPTVASARVRILENERISQWYGFQTTGRLYVTPEEIIAKQTVMANGAKQPYLVATEHTGDIELVDQNKDGKVDNADRVLLGRFDPKAFGGFGFTVNYKGFYVNTVFSYAYGHKRLLTYAMNESSPTTSYNVTNYVSGNSATINDPYTASYPRFVLNSTGGNANRLSDWYLHDASYVRLNALNLGYKIPRRMLKNTMIQSIDLTFQTSNLLTITNYPGFDPQGNWSGSTLGSGMGEDNNTYPASINYNFGIRVNFK